jgi:hypothetical protein
VRLSKNHDSLGDLVEYKPFSHRFKKPKVSIRGMKRFLFVGLASLVACATPAVVAPKKHDPRFWHGDFLYRAPVEETGIVSISSATNTRISHLSEREGIAHLHSLVQTENTEDAYAYFPEHNLWMDIGGKNAKIDEHIDGEDGVQVRRLGYFVQVNHGTVRDFIEDNPKTSQVTLYHFHPHVFTHEMAAILRTESPEFLIDKTDSPEKFSMRIARYFSQLPSSADVYSSAMRRLDFHLVHPHVQVTHRVVGMQGVTSYGLTAKGLHDLPTMKYSDLKQHCAQYYHTQLLLSVSLASMGIEPQDAIYVMMERLNNGYGMLTPEGVKWAKQDLFEYSFVPHEK